MACKEDEWEAKYQDGVEMFSQALKVLAKPQFVGSGANPNTTDPSSQVNRGGTEKRKNQKKKSSNRKKDTAVNSGTKGTEIGPPPDSYWSKVDKYFKDITEDDIKTFQPLSDAELASRLTMPPLGEPFWDRWEKENRLAREKAAREHMAIVGAVLRDKALAATATEVTKELPTAPRSKIYKAIVSFPSMNFLDLCDACNGRQVLDSNKVVFCESCETPVHQECLGLPKSSDPWLCLRCRANSQRQLCMLCPLDDGVLVRASTGGSILLDQCAHIFCALWLADAHLHRDVNLERIAVLDGLQHSFNKLQCSVCNLDTGVCICCNEDGCSTAFHPNCARSAKFLMEIAMVDGSNDLQMMAYCLEHTRIRVLDVKASKDKRELKLRQRVMFKETKAFVTSKDFGKEAGIKEENEDSYCESSEMEISDEGKEDEILAKAEGGEFLEEIADDELEIDLEEEEVQRWLPEFNHVLEMPPSPPREPGEIHPVIMKLLDRGILGRPNPFSHLRAVRSKQTHLSEAIPVERPLETLEEVKETSSKAKIPQRVKIKLKGEVQILGGSKSDHEEIDEKTTSNSIEFLAKYGIRKSILKREAWEEIRRESGLSYEEYMMGGYIPSDVKDTKILEYKKRLENASNHIWMEPMNELQESILINQIKLIENMREMTELANSLQGPILQQVISQQNERLFRESDRRLMVKHLAFVKDEKKREKLEKRKKELERKQQLLAASLNTPSGLTPGRNTRQSVALAERREARAQRGRGRGRRSQVSVGDPKNGRRASGRGIQSVQVAVPPGRGTPRGRGRPSAAHTALSRGVSGQIVEGEEQGFLGGGVVPVSHFPGGVALGSQVPNQGRGRTLSRASSRMFAPYDLKNASWEEGENAFICAVCASADVPQSKESEENSKMVVCQRCKVVVHEVCYGVDSNLCEGSQWFCQPCKFEFRRALEKSRALNPHASQNPEDVWRELRAPEVDPCGFLRPGVDCRICPGKVGAFKGSPATLADFGTSISGAALWAHVHCAQWINETQVGEREDEPIIGLDRVQMDRFNGLCRLCKQSTGACIKCNFGNCSQVFHPSCGRNLGFVMTLKTKPGGRMVPRSYCARHSTEQQKANPQVVVEVQPAAEPQPPEPQESQDFSFVRDLRSGFEKLRLISERVVKREKHKKEFGICYHCECLLSLASQGDSGASVPKEILEALNVAVEEEENKPYEADSEEEMEMPLAEKLATMLSSHLQKTDEPQETTSALHVPSEIPQLAPTAPTEVASPPVSKNKKSQPAKRGRFRGRGRGRSSVESPS